VAIASQVARFVIRMGAMMILARLLTPEDFGLQGMVVAVSAYLGLVRDFGLSAATVQMQALTPDKVSTLFWINAALGTLLAAVLVALSPLIAWFYDDARLTVIAAVSAIAFVAGGLAVQHMALLQRRMRFTSIAVVDVTALAVSAATGICMAWFGFGYWALVGMTVALPVATMLGAWISLPWVPCAPRRGVGVRQMMRFGGILTLNQIIVNVALNVDKLLLGYRWGAVPLGLYGRAYSLATMPSEQIVTALANVVIPGLSRMQGDEGKLKRAFLDAYSISLAINMLGATLCIVCAEEIVHLVFGPNWSTAIPVFRILAAWILVLSSVQPLSWFLIASGRAMRTVHLALLFSPVIILGVLVGLPFGIEGVAMGMLGAMALLVCPTVFLARAGTSLRASEIFWAMSRPGLAVVAGCVAGFSLKATGVFEANLAAGVLGYGLVVATAFLVTLFFPFTEKAAYVALVRHAHTSLMVRRP
jgi:PST family polysaccharide transporter